MTAEIDPERKRPESLDTRASKGKARLELAKGGKTISVHVDRQGFRRLLETLEKLAATGERQTFEKSGRHRRNTKDRTTEGGNLLDKLVFHIDDSNA